MGMKALGGVYPFGFGRAFKHDFRESYGQNAYQYPSGIITDYQPR